MFVVAADVLLDFRLLSLPVKRLAGKTANRGAKMTDIVSRGTLNHDNPMHFISFVVYSSIAN